MGVGVRQRLTGVVAGGGIVVWETDVLNPPSAALHCPPHTSWLLFLKSGRVRQLRLIPPLRGRQLTLQKSPASELLGFRRIACVICSPMREVSRTTPRTPSTFVLILGARQGGGSWRPVALRLRAAGHWVLT
ncbi:hypothetical protein ABT039_33275 [Streptomyces lasiicapitis]|uniref:hypothetical protein n=1 Tax=Streptomyces lasiicapitis TaxID=1923961 RepID=UPI00332ACB79